MNEENELRYPKWQIPVQDAILETSLAQFPEKVRAAEAKISERLRQIGQSNGDRHERDAIDFSLSLLRAIKQERFGDRLKEDSARTEEQYG
jgi:hypothetical protein